MPTQERKDYEKEVLWEITDAIDDAIIQLGVAGKYKSYEERRKHIGRVLEALDMYIHMSKGGSQALCK